jgi:hypothetical protein
MYARKHAGEHDFGVLRSYLEQPRWKRTVQRIAASSPGLVDLLLAPACAVGLRFFHVPKLRALGVRALQIRRRIHWLNAVLKLEMR